MDVFKITQVTSKGYFTEGCYFQHSKESIYEIIFDCKELLKAYGKVSMDLENYAYNCHIDCIEKSKKGESTPEMWAVDEGVDKANIYIRKRAMHLNKILLQAVEAEKHM